MTDQLSLIELPPRTWESDQPTRRDITYVGQCVKCHAKYRVQWDGQFPAVWCLCRAHLGKQWTGIKWKRLHAEEVPGSPCDARCTGAIGPDCECSCGGRNHGIDHAI